MKHKGSRSETLYERDVFLLKIYRRLKRTCLYRSMGEICRDMAVMPTDRHYLSEKMGAIIWARWRKTRRLPDGHACKLRLYRSFVTECERLSGEGLRHMEVVRRALERPAVCPGISSGHIFAILKRLNQK